MNALRSGKSPIHRVKRLPFSAMSAKFYFYFFSDLAPLADGEGTL